MPVEERIRVDIASPAPVPSAFRHRPALDALRGVAVLLVVAFHSEIGIARGGYLGVSTFFTLSGFLIATLALAEHRSTGTFDLRGFWTRRFRRLIPGAVLAVGIAVVLVAVIGDPASQPGLGEDAAGSVFYIANWQQLFGGTSYAELFVAPSPLVHMWSLAVEEQFYLVFPLLLMALIGWRRTASSPRRLSLWARLGIAAAAAIVVSALLPLVLDLGTDRTYYGTDTRAAEIAVGVLLAVLLLPRSTAPAAESPVPRRRSATVLAAASVVALAAMAVAWAVVPETSELWRHGGFLLYAVGSATLVACAVLVVGPVAHLGSLRPLCRLGVISYAVYLLHWPILWALDRTTSWAPVVRFAVALAASVAIAELSYRMIEMPVRRTGRIAGVRALGLVPALALVVIVGAVLVARAAPAPEIDYAAAAERLAAADSVQDPPDATIGQADTAAPGELRIAFFGDSTATMAAAGAQIAAEDDPRATVLEGVAELGCGILFADRVRGGDDVVTTVADKCVRWPQIWRDRVAVVRPDVSVVMAGVWETWDMQWEGVDGWHALGDPVGDAHARQLLQQVVDTLSSEGGRVALVTTSHVDRRPIGPGTCSCPDRLDRWNELLRETADANPEAAFVVDLDGWLRSIGPDEDERLRLDGVHFSETTATEVARRWLLDQVIPVDRSTPPAQ
ncbi:MAG TPA: acyltransferase family protein [Acidimicrobiales bacterium]